MSRGENHGFLFMTTHSFKCAASDWEPSAVWLLTLGEMYRRGETLRVRFGFQFGWVTNEPDCELIRQKIHQKEKHHSCLCSSFTSPTSKLMYDRSTLKIRKIICVCTEVELFHPDGAVGGYCAVWSEGLRRWPHCCEINLKATKLLTATEQK